MVHIHTVSGRVFHTSTDNGEVDDLMKDSNEVIAVIDADNDLRVYAIAKKHIVAVEYTE